MNTSLLETYRWQAYVKTCAQRGDLKVIFERGENPQPRTSKDTLILPLPTPQTTQNEQTKLLRFANHESSHHEYSTDFDLIEENPDLSPSLTFAGEIWNAFEDNRVDRLANNEWFGVKENNNDFYEIFMPELIEMHTKFQKDPFFTKEFKDRRSSLIYISLENQVSEVPLIATYLDEFRALLSPEALAYVDEFNKGNYRRRILDAPDGLKGSKETADIALEVLDKVYGGEEQPPESENDGSQSSNSSESGEGEEEEGEQTGESSEEESDDGESSSEDEGEKEEEEGEESQGDSESAGEEEEQEEGEKESSNSGEEESEEKQGEEETPSQQQMKEKYEESYPDANLQQGEHSDRGEGGGNQVAEVLEWNYTIDDCDSPFVPAPLDEIEVLDYETMTAHNCEFGLHDWWGGVDVDGTLAEIKEIESDNNGRQLAATIRKLLQIRTRTRWSYGRKKGRLDGKNLHRLMIPEGGSFSERVFKKKEEGIALDTAVQVLVDCSGSMAGIKHATAIVSANMLCDTISRSLRVPVEILGFTGRQVSRMAIFKSFDRPVSYGELQERMVNVPELLTYNADGEAINWAYQRLIKRREKKKLMIVLSDGSPALDDEHRGGDIHAYTKQVIEEIEERSPVDIVAIGIINSYVEWLYKQHQIIFRPNELEGALLAIIKTKILNGVVK